MNTSALVIICNLGVHVFCFLRCIQKFGMRRRLLAVFIKIWYHELNVEIGLGFVWVNCNDVA